MAKVNATVAPEKTDAEAVGKPHVNLSKFKRGQQLTTPILSMAHNDVLYVKVTDKLYDAPMPSLARNTNKTIPCVRVINLETGEPAVLICPAVLVSTLTGISDYVGKSFEIANGPPIAGKSHRNVDIYELT